MKAIATLLLLFVLHTVYGQTDSFWMLLDSAKTMFKREQGLSQPELDTFNYRPIEQKLKEAIALNPNSEEAHYFLAYTYSRINSRDGRTMLSTNKELVIKASEEFEQVIKLTPKYKGDIISLDPYSKLSSEWGALGLSYINRNLLDSARWAFQEGKRRGGFSRFILDVNKAVLDACSPNAILITSGDLYTIPLWYLQFVQAYRTDVSVVDVSLLGTQWYPSFLTDSKSVSFDLPKAVLDTIDYIAWQDTDVTINDFTWTISPSYYNQYLFRNDRVLLSLLKENKFKREVYFTTGFVKDMQLSLTDYLNSLAVVDKLGFIKEPGLNYTNYYNNMEKLLQLANEINRNSIDECFMLDGYRYSIFSKVYNFIMNNEKPKASALLKLLDTYVNEKDFPYRDGQARKYLEQLKLECK